MRDRESVGSTFLNWIKGCAEDLREPGNKLMLADINDTIGDLLQGIGAMEMIGAENVFAVKSDIGVSNH